MAKKTDEVRTQSGRPLCQRSHHFNLAITSKMTRPLFHILPAVEHGRSADMREGPDQRMRTDIDVEVLKTPKADLAAHSAHLIAARA